MNLASSNLALSAEKIKNSHQERSTLSRKIKNYKVSQSQNHNQATNLNQPQNLHPNSLQPEKPIIYLDFRVRFYPENIESDLMQSITQRLFFMQIRDQILQGVLPCSPEAAVKFAALNCQAIFGDWEAIHQQFYVPVNNNRKSIRGSHSQHNLAMAGSTTTGLNMNFGNSQSHHQLDANNLLNNNSNSSPSYDYARVYNYLIQSGGKLVPDKIKKNLQDSVFLEDHNLNSYQQSQYSKEDSVKIKLITHVVNQYQELNGILPDEAIVLYLKDAQVLPGFGTSYWAVGSNHMDLLDTRSDSAKKLNSIGKNEENLGTSVSALDRLKLKNLASKKSTFEANQQFWLGVNQKGISLYEISDTDKTFPIKEWKWPQIIDTENSSNKFILKVKGNPDPGNDNINVNSPGEKVSTTLSFGNLNQIQQQNLAGANVISGSVMALNTLDRFDRNNISGSPNPSSMGGVYCGKKKIMNKISSKLFFVQSAEYSISIAETCHGNHKLYFSRRRVDNNYQNKLRMLSISESKSKILERQVLVRERNQRQQLQQKLAEYDIKMAKLQEHNENLLIYQNEAEANKQKFLIMKNDLQLRFEALTATNHKLMSEKNQLEMIINQLKNENHNLKCRIGVTDQNLNDLLENRVSLPSSSIGYQNNNNNQPINKFIPYGHNVITSINSNNINSVNSQNFGSQGHLVPRPGPVTTTNSNNIMQNISYNQLHGQMNHNNAINGPIQIPVTKDLGGHERPQTDMMITKRVMELQNINSNQMNNDLIESDGIRTANSAFSPAIQYNSNNHHNPNNNNNNNDLEISNSNHENHDTIRMHSDTCINNSETESINSNRTINNKDCPSDMESLQNMNMYDKHGIRSIPIQRAEPVQVGPGGSNLMNVSSSNENNNHNNHHHQNHNNSHLLVPNKPIDPISIDGNSNIEDAQNQTVNTDLIIRKFKEYDLKIE